MHEIIVVDFGLRFRGIKTVQEKTWMDHVRSLEKYHVNDKPQWMTLTRVKWKVLTMQQTTLQIIF